MTFKKIEDPSDLKKFNDSISEVLGFRYPFLYLKRSDVYIWEKKGEIAAGFVLCPFAGWSGFRSLKQIPEKRLLSVIERMHHDKILKKAKNTDFMEYTGYFIKDKSIGFLFTLCMILTAISKSSYFILSFDKSSRHLSDYYNHGNPMVLYSGPVTYHIQNDIGELSSVEGIEIVEVLSSVGIFKIFIWRTHKEIKRCLLTLFRRISSAISSLR